MPPTTASLHQMKQFQKLNNVHSASKHFSYVQRSNTSTATISSVASWCFQTVYKELCYCNAYDARLRTNELLTSSVTQINSLSRRQRPDNVRYSDAFHLRALSETLLELFISTYLILTVKLILTNVTNKPHETV